MEIFVTGGTGNIGQHVTLALLERGRARRGEELRLHLFHWTVPKKADNRKKTPPVVE